ncbi:hypothetical protein BD770DRAFT_446117 [Pilaira anomala]|nr:hypothetical protein BD770DRAFT_446117 [Pilaira anomala]
MNNLPTALKNSRCILHIDLDCFYCQVEQVRLGIPFDVPAGVQQWRGLIAAVNYAARKAGVERHADIADAKKTCPEIQLLHVATYGPNDTEPQYHPNPDRRTHKVSLDPYRNASREIFKIFHQYCDTIQKIGTDEGFMDVTKIVNERLISRYIDRMPELLDRLEDQVCGISIDWDSLGIVIRSQEEEEEEEKVAALDDGDGSTTTTTSTTSTTTTTTTWGDLQLAIGAEIAAEIRKEVYDKLNYTCSAGIAHYKTVAKLCSSKNKPNKQTVLREVARLDFMRDVPFKKIRNLGGKLGSEVGADLEALNASDIFKYTVEDLQRKFGKSTGLYIYNICRGIDDEEVNATKAPKSLMAAKSFNPVIKSPEEMQAWFSILSVELHSRILRNYQDFGTWPKTITIRYCSTYGGYRTKAIGSIHKDEMKTHEALFKKFQHTYNLIPDAYPCKGLDLVATGLSHDESSKSYTLNKFFTTSSTSAHEANRNLTFEKHTIKSTTTTTTIIDEIPKQKSNKTPFFPTKQQPSSSSRSQENTNSWVCDSCNQPIPISEIEEHTDYHFALEISQQDQQQQHIPTKRKAVPTTFEEEKTKKLSSHSFFVRRS